MQSTRQRILEHLEQRGAATPRQMAAAFGMSAANLRRHLAILQGRGLVQPAGWRRTEGRGRPQQIFALSPAAQGDEGLEALARALLAQLGERPRPARLRALAAELAGEAGLPPGQTQRLVAAVQRLTPLGYKPHWEARPQGPQVVLGRCPYASLVAEHPVLCRMDAELLAQLLGGPVEQIAKLQPGPDGLPQCVFAVRGE
ncbi:MAG: helix-turn-helix domain-containing protein [Anaerolineales bacterium]|nr:helix-turn-helix domain-containing protein [Anaerolineales bacterium]